MIFENLKVLLQHRHQTIKRLEKQELPAPFRGRPVLISKGLTPDMLAKCMELCPTGAIGSNPFSLDMGRCLFCSECARLLPANIRFTQSWYLWAFRREDLVVVADVEHSGAYDRQGLDGMRFPVFRDGINLRQVCAGGDGANELELSAAGNVNFDMGRYGIEFTASPRHADGLVLTGPITKKMATPLDATFEAMAHPKVLICVGTEAISGGLYDKTTEVKQKFLKVNTPNLYVAGNPIHPLSFIFGVRDLVGQLDAQGSRRYRFSKRVKTKVAALELNKRLRGLVRR